VYSKGLRIAAIAAAYVVSGFLCFFLPKLVGWSGRLVLAFFLPTMAVGICVLFRQLASSDPLRVNYARFRDTYELILNAVVIFIVGLHLTLLGTLLGGPSRWIGRVPSLLIGVLLVVVGCALPRVRPNLALGIRTPWTLHNEKVWAGTHRAGGYVLVAFGIVILTCTALAPQWLGKLVVFGAGAGVIALAALSYWSCRSQLELERRSSDSSQPR
jgi:hypothetical protein